MIRIIPKKTLYTNITAKDGLIRFKITLIQLRLCSDKTAIDRNSISQTKMHPSITRTAIWMPGRLISTSCHPNLGVIIIHRSYLNSLLGITKSLSPACAVSCSTGFDVKYSRICGQTKGKAKNHYCDNE